VKLKVWVTDDDNIWSRDDDIDGFVKLIKMTPARRSWLASWQFGTIYGIRPEKKTKSVEVFFFCQICLELCCRMAL